MKKLKFLLVVLAAFLVLPFGVFAETSDTADKTESDTSIEEVNLYFFHGNGCPHCEEAQEWFDEIEDEYGDKFNLVSYEVWYDEENSSLMSAVAEARGETADGVPYIIVGNQSWSGFDESYEEAILSKIESEYDQDPEERYDVMDYVTVGDSDEEDSTGRDVLILILIVAVVGAIGAGVVVARKNTN